MEELKYYTPSIEEFHSGFDYQIEDNGHWYGRNNPPYPLVEMLQRNNYRVKYLDRSDIESLGWRVDPERTWCTTGENISIPFIKDNVAALTFRPNENLVAIRNNNQYFGALIEGSTYKIKNKSELKRLMVQLGIIE